MKRVTLLCLRDFNDLVDIEIGGCALTVECDSLVNAICGCQFDVLGSQDADRREPHFPGGSRNSDGDLAAVCDQQALHQFEPFEFAETDERGLGRARTRIV